MQAGCYKAKQLRNVRGQVRPCEEGESLSGIEQQWRFSNHVRSQERAVLCLSWFHCALGCSARLEFKDVFCKNVSSCIVFRVIRVLGLLVKKTIFKKNWFFFLVNMMFEGFPEDRRGRLNPLP